MDLLLHRRLCIPKRHWEVLPDRLLSLQHDITTEDELQRHDVGQAISRTNVTQLRVVQLDGWESVATFVPSTANTNRRYASRETATKRTSDIIGISGTSPRSPRPHFALNILLEIFVVDLISVISVTKLIHLD